MLPFSLPYQLLAAILALLSALGGGYYAGRHHAALACQAEKSAALADAHARWQAAQMKADEVLAATETRQRQAQQTHRVLQQEVIRYVQTHAAATAQVAALDCRLDADGLRLWQRANAPAPDAPAQPDHAVP